MGCVFEALQCVKLTTNCIFFTVCLIDFVLFSPPLIVFILNLILLLIFILFQDLESALHYEARKGRIEIIQLLLGAGADVYLINKVSFVCALCLFTIRIQFSPVNFSYSRIVLIVR